ncbi:MAG: hypothetical protein RL518_562 [Pseudomonadota bacterium]|jgi:drug/metabolite transporter (DMT)-like permease
MFGIALAAIAGVLLSFADAGKKLLANTFSPEVVILLMFSFGVAVNLLFLSLKGLPAIEWGSVWLPTLLCALVAAAGELLFLYGLRGTDLSIALPLMAFLPVFSSLLGYMLFGEVPDVLGGFGAVTIIIGTYLLGINLPLHKNILQPFTKIISDRACLFILLSALIGAILFVGQRFGVRHSSPVSFFTLTLIVDWFLFLVLVIWNGRIWNGRIRPIGGVTPQLISTLCGTGITWAVALTCLYASYNYTLAVYAGSALQVQTLLSITLGALIFKEERYLQRMSAGVVIVVGVLMISWAAAS